MTAGGTSEWTTVTQERIDRFADATGDRQWIHTDPERASAESPYKATIAHGFLTLSLIPALAKSAIHMQSRMAVNYGLNKVRFLRPVIAGSKVRGRFEALKVEDERESQKITWKVTIEGEDSKPVAVVEWIVVYHH